MKKYILILSLLFAAKSKAQIVDTSITRVTAVKIDTFYIDKKFPNVGKDTATHLGIWLVFDDLKSEAKLQVTVCNKEKNIIVFDDAITGEAYTAWKGDNKYPFIFIANKYGLTFKKD